MGTECRNKVTLKLLEAERYMANLLRDTELHKLNSNPDEVWFKNHMKIDNTNLEPVEVADMVIKHFGLVTNEKEEKEYRFGA